MLKRLFIAIILLGLLGGGLVGFNMMRDKGIAQFFANMPVAPLAVTTLEVEAISWTPVIEAIGTVNAARGIELTVEAAGIVNSVTFEANQQVHEGDLLLNLDDAVQRADLEAARTQAELDAESRDRTRELRTRGVTSGVTLDTAEAAASASRAQVARAEAILAQKQLIAPFDGTIGIPQVDPGQYVTPGQRIASLQDLSTLHVDFTIPEQRFSELSIGQTARLVFDGDRDDLTGEVIGIDPRVDPATRLVSVRVSVDNPDGTLTPGQFVRVQVVLPTEADVIVVPQTALVTSLYGDYVYAVRPKEGATGPDGAPVLEARQLFVTPGRFAEGYVEILRGLEAGETVVNAGQNRLSNGAPVFVDNSAEAETPQ